MSDSALSLPTHAAVSNPLATGQDGAFFEQHVDAFFLALLLVRGIPPIFVDTQLEEVTFQTERLGRNTDDILLHCRTGTQTDRRLYAQVKRSFTVSATDEDCVKTFTDFWLDFVNARCFLQGTDAFAVITRHGTNVLLEHFAPLLDSARVAATSAEFFARLSTLGLLSAKSVAYASAVRQILDAAKGAPVTDDELWQLLRHVYVLSFDLNSTTCQTESLIRTMLAHTAQGADPPGIAESTWLRLLQLVGRDGMPRAGGYTWQGLPEDLRQRHTPLPASDHVTLRTLLERTRTVRRTIRTVVGGPAARFHIRRDELVASIGQSLRATSAVIVTGPSGVGKSAVAGEAFDQLQRDQFAFAFRADEFATAHLDTTLQNAQIPVTAERLAGLLAGQANKVLLIESVERLLEKETRDAFTDLLTLVCDDPSWQLILTCRDYSLDTVRSSLLDYASISYSVVEIPPLSEQELDSAIEALPALQRPATSPALRQLFRNPYVLDKATTMDWPAERPQPADERAFRQKFMREVVRAEQLARQGMPQRRGSAFAQVALRRARALEPYARCDDLDPAALESLFQQDLIVYAEGSRSLAAPAHDVLEDWAILEWIEDRSRVHGVSFSAFIEELGAHPAVRRAYRKWLSELLASDVPRADALASAVVQNPDLLPYFSDDTLVAVLRSSGAAQFLDRHTALLLANDAELLRRVIHLIRVACKTTPTWLPTGTRLPAVYFVPQGEAWSAVLRVVREHLPVLTPRYTPLLVGLINDWTGAIHVNDTLPPGSGDASAIAHAMLPHLTDYRAEKSLEQVVRLLAMIPLADEAAFRQLLANSAKAKRHVAQALKDTLLLSLQSLAACRDVPDALIDLAERTFYVTDDDLRNPRFGTHELELEPVFGLKNCGTNDFLPPSALRGPFLFLLQFHPDVAVPFLIRFLDRAVDWYGHRRLRRRRPLEQPWETELLLPDGTRVRQWCSGRLWPLYRGLSVGPYILKSALMALEHWLLHLCETQPAEVEAILLRLLRESQNAAVSAVVASVATAHPEIAGAAAVALLTCRDFVLLDGSRARADTGAMKQMRGMLPSRPEQQLYDHEREQSDALPHRRMDLEFTALRLQGTHWREAVQTVLDGHQHELPPVDQQTDDDRRWRISLQNMDLRQYSAHPAPHEDQPTNDEDRSASSPAGRRVLLQPAPLPEDIQAMIDEDAPARAAENNSMTLFMWGYTVFQDRASPAAADWRTQLNAARTPVDAEEAPADLGGSTFRVRGIEFVAAVVVRDHCDDLSPEDRSWCFDTLCNCIGIEADSADELLSVQRGGVDSGRAAAFVLPILLSKGLPAEQQLRAIRCIAVALTHGVDEVIDFAIEGVRQFLWSADPELCRTCCGALARAARELDDQLEAQRGREWTERASSRDLERAIAERVRTEIVQRRPTLQDDVRLNSPGWHSRHTGLRVLTLLADQVHDPLARTVYTAAIEQLLDQWGDEHDERERRDYAWEGECARQVARFAISLPLADSQALVAPLVQLLDDHPDRVASFVEDLVTAENALSKPETFWAIWQRFVDRALQSAWPRRLEVYGEHDELLRYLFLGLPWNHGVRHWNSLDGQAQRIDQLFRALPSCAAVLDAYVGFLLTVGSKSLPRAFIEISRQMSQANAQEMLALSNTVTGLEILLRRYVYAVPAFLKSHGNLRQAVLHLLDELVEAGSSAAYRMRDDFVTPSPG